MSEESSDNAKFKSRLPTVKPAVSQLPRPSTKGVSTPLRKIGSLSAINQSNLKPMVSNPASLRTTRSVISGPSSSASSSLLVALPRPARPSKQSQGSSTPVKRNAVQPASTSIRVKKLPSRSPIPMQNSPPERIDAEKPLNTPCLGGKVPLKALIARKRQELQQSSQSSNGPDEVFGALVVENVLVEDDAGRRSLKDTIERARTSGILNISSRSLSSLPIHLFTIHLGVEPEPLPSINQDVPPEDKVPSTTLPYYEVVDLVTLKARNNCIVLIQPEISLFGSLGFIDFHNNALTSLPSSFGDLLQLSHLDLSSNRFESFPQQLLCLPSLASLNLSSNQLLNIQWVASSPHSQGVTGPYNPFYSPSSPLSANDILPALHTLQVSANKLKASSINRSFPKSLVKLDLSHNPLGTTESGILLASLGALKSLKELNLQRTELEDIMFNTQPLSSFNQLEVLNVKDNPWISVTSIRTFFTAAGKTLSLEDLGPNRLSGTLRIEANSSDSTQDLSTNLVEKTQSPGIPKVSPETEADSDQPKLQPQGMADAAQTLVAKVEELRIVQEQPLLVSDQVLAKQSGQTVLDKYFDPHLSALSLPPLKPSTHLRSASVAPHSSSAHMQLNSTLDPHLPRETVPLGLIESQSWAMNLRSLCLVNRRADVLFTLKSGLSGLPRLEELDLRGSGLRDDVRVRIDQDVEIRQPVLGIIDSHCPSLRILDLSENQLTELPGLSRLFLPDHQHRREALRVLRVRGNAISNLEGLVEVAERFGRGEVEGWSGEEIDIRDNQISKLPPVLGLLQLDVFLVEGNRFRVPQRTVWLREGTKGLLRFLRESG